MNDTTCYRNTDLDLISAEDLTPIATAFKTQRISPLRVWLDNSG